MPASTYLLNVIPSLPAERWQSAGVVRADGPEAAVRALAPRLTTNVDTLTRRYTVVVARLSLPAGGLGVLTETDCGSFRVIAAGPAVEVRPLRPCPDEDTR